MLRHSHARQHKSALVAEGRVPAVVAGLSTWDLWNRVQSAWLSTKRFSHRVTEEQRRVLFSRVLVSAAQAAKHETA